MSKIEFNREPKINPIFSIQRVFADDNGDARPRLFQKNGDVFDNTWRISFQTKSREETFEVVIKNFNQGREVRVFAYLHGDEAEVLNYDEYRAKIEETIQYSPHPSGSPELAISEEEAEAIVQKKTLVIDERWFWMRVEDCVRRFESLEFLFRV